MEPFDRALADLMRKYRVPGGAVAVSRHGKLVLAHGYGYADMESREPVQPDSVFRIASLSKPITSAAVLTLVEQGKLSLDSRVLDVLPSSRRTAAAGWSDITVRHLLWHAGGWDRDRQGGYDPMFLPARIARETGSASPAGPPAILRWMLGQPLDFRPGAAHAYSNFGYSALGRVIESVSGEPYENYVREHVLEPAGMRRTRLGASLPAGRVAGEVRYYDYPGAPAAPSIFPGQGRCPRPYGSFHLEAMDAHGGWVSSAIDMVLFVQALEGRGRPALLQSGTTAAMLARPPEPVSPGGAPAWYGMGWQVRPAPGGETNWWHTGSLPGTAALLVRAGTSGMCWAALFNMRPEDDRAFLADLDRSIWEGLRQAAAFPSRDLLPLYSGSVSSTYVPDGSVRKISAMPRAGILR